LKAWDNCIHPDFAREKNVSGWMAIADYDSLDNFKEGKKGKDTTMGKYIMELDKRLPGKGIELLTSTYTDATGHRGFPEVVLFPWSPHPGKENQYTEAKTEEDAADAIAAMSDRFNYLPIACITERGVVEAFSGDFKAGDLPAYALSALPGSVTRKAIDKHQSDYLEMMMTKGKEIDTIGNINIMFDKRTGFYVMNGFGSWYKNPTTLNWSPYSEMLLSLDTRELQERMIEYKIKYRSFDKTKHRVTDTLLDGSQTKREFIFERPDELYKQFKELGIRLPSSLVPFIWEATETYQKDKANEKQKDDPRGAEEARRKAGEAKNKIQQSLEFIAKAKAEREAKAKGPKRPATLKIRVASKFEAKEPLFPVPAPAPAPAPAPEPTSTLLPGAVTPIYGAETPTFPAPAPAPAPVPASPEYSAASPLYGAVTPPYGAVTPTFPAPAPAPAPAPTSPPYSAESPSNYVASPHVPFELRGQQTNIPILRRYEDAYYLGKAVIDRGDIRPFPLGNGLRNKGAKPWEINEKSLNRTLDYIFNYVYNTCYMLCVYDHVPYLFKLEPQGMNQEIKETLAKEIADKGITDLNIETARLMGCIVKPRPTQDSVSKEWLVFLQSLYAKKYNFPNGVFILGLTDAVILREDLKDPFPGVPESLPKKYKGYYLPILAYSGRFEYDDAPIPNFDDIFEVKRLDDGTVNVEATLGTGLVNKWSEKINKVVFRGGTTGCGTTAKTNQRIEVCSQAFQDSLRNKGMLDVGITTVTKNYKIDIERGLSRIDPASVIMKEPIPMGEQSRYKYILHIDGNVHAYRLLKSMLLGSCVLRVVSPYYGWAEDRLYRGFDINDRSLDVNSFYTHILVNPNTERPLHEQLDEVLEWCKNNEADCERFAKNGRLAALESVNLLNDSVQIAIADVQGGGKQKKGTMKQRQTKQKKRYTRRLQRLAEEDKLVLAEYRGGGIDDDMLEYVQSSMSNVWKSYIQTNKK
jgi:hypothetical protein